MQLVPRHQPTKASLGGLRFQYNPSTFTDSQSVTFNEVKTPGMSYPLFVYAGAERRTMTFDIFVSDRMEPGITKKWLWHLESFMPSQNLDSEVHPRSLIFAFGWSGSECYLTNLETKFTEFSPELEPTEATFSVTLILKKDNYY